MIYVTGDMHGDATRFRGSALRALKKGDTLIICGDFGFIWDGSGKEKGILKKIGKLRYNVCFIDGVHENFQLIQSYPVEDFFGAPAHRISGNLYHLMRGHLYQIEGKRVFAMGGGVSPDEDFRDHDDSRMREEFPSRSELETATATIEQTRGTLDYIVTHEPPTKIKAFLQLKTHHHPAEVTGLGTFLEEIGKCCTFRRWFFGSMHTDKIIANSHVAVFRNVVPAELNEKK